MTKARVLLVVRPADGGIVKHIRMILKNLSNEFSLTVACPEKQAGEYTDLDCGIVLLPLRGTFNPISDVQVSRILLRTVKKGCYDLIHAHGFKAGFLARPISRITRVPCLLTVHNEFARAKASRIPGLFFIAEKALARWTTAYIAVSAWLAREMNCTLGIANDRIHIVPNGIEIEANCEPDPLLLPVEEESYLVGTVARLAPQKGLDIFLLAAAFLAPRFPQARFIIAGDGPLRGPLEQLAVDLGLQDKVAFLGYCRQVPALLSRLNIFVMPSRSEAQGIAVLEAMAAGCPVIASNVGGLQELVQDGHNGLLVPCGNAAALSSAIGELILDPRYAAALAAQAKNDVCIFDTLHSIQKTKEVYDRILEGGYRQ